MLRSRCEASADRQRQRVERSRRFAGIGLLRLVLGLAYLSLLVIGGAVMVFFAFVHDTPEKAFDDLQDALMKKDYGRFYDRMDSNGQQQLEKRAEMMTQSDPSMTAHNGKKGRELFVAVSKDMDRKSPGSGWNPADRMREEHKNTVVTKVVVQRGTATITLSTERGIETGQMVKQGGRWRASGE